MGSYVARAEPDHGLAVWCIRGRRLRPELWAQHLDDMREVARWRLPYRPAVIIHMVDDTFVPDAKQRSDIARLSADPGYRPNLAVISNNPLIRGVMRAFTWLQTAQPYRIDAFGDVAQALRWLEADRGEGLGRLTVMLRDAHRELGIAHPLSSYIPPPPDRSSENGGNKADTR